MLRKTESRKRVEEELEERGMLLVEGSNEFPSVAGLQADNPGKVGGFSWDSAPAHALAQGLAQDREVVRLNLYRGKDTLVHQRLWPALNSIATFNVESVSSGAAGLKPKKLYFAVQDDPGISGEELKSEFEQDGGGRGYGFVLADLQALLCIVNEARTDTPSALPSDLVWYHWKRGRVSRMLGSGEPPPIKDAIKIMMSAALPGTKSKPVALFPCLKLAIKASSETGN
ncbi:MAG: hypothetical protein HOB82_06295 [Alphaproteobacteria bacterium]|jgi:hypothetical protein|nr:hypothetical protein [Alphaproteobacteria bacterium]MBT4711120.1 hypothetical protein [Alphaproteobacteria bacterium]MBT5860867.1 hypothetical protein [Alphaproteobacteria bacterium]